MQRVERETAGAGSTPEPDGGEPQHARPAPSRPRSPGQERQRGEDPTPSAKPASPASPSTSGSTSSRSVASYLVSVTRREPRQRHPDEQRPGAERDAADARRDTSAPTSASGPRTRTLSTRPRRGRPSRRAARRRASSATERDRAGDQGAAAREAREPLSRPHAPVRDRYQATVRSSPSRSGVGAPAEEPLARDASSHRRGWPFGIDVSQRLAVKAGHIGDELGEVPDRDLVAGAEVDRLGPS